VPEGVGDACDQDADLVDAVLGVAEAVGPEVAEGVVLGVAQVEMVM
jgi:hypothetical protein